MVAPTLLDCWHVRDLQRFRAVLKGGPFDKGGPQLNGNSSSSYTAAYSKSPHSHKDSPSGPCPPAEVNRRDHYGRSVLHHIASSVEPWSVDYLHAILSHPSVNVNLQDGENGWTALHRALYVANLQTAIILLRRNDTDIRVKDLEGLTAFDLYNSTVAGTNPPSDAVLFDSLQHALHGRTLTQLFTWGSNRNYNLGLGDGDDRQLPDRVNLRPAQPSSVDNQPFVLPAGKKFDRIGIQDVAMSRLHTVVLTDEKVSNVWVCGLGGNGRLGRSPQTQTSFEPLKDFQETARSIAVAQDHTLIITTSGAVYSFGLNRFSQLGYVIEQGFGAVGSTSGKVGGGANVATFGQPAVNANADLDVQISPRRIVGPLKKEAVLGAACSRLHSAVFTSEGLYTWGTNTGQLGYDRSGTTVQIQPRKVTALAAGAGIQQVAATDFGTACLMEGGDVFVWHNDTHFRINFPLARFSSGISVFRPRQVQPKTLISKLSSSGNTFSALSDMGDLFTFNLEHPSEYGNNAGGNRSSSGQTSSNKNSAAQLAPKPQLLWSVRKKFTAVRDVAIGTDGAVILCTESGHCFVRPRRSDGGPKSGGKNFKFQQIPYLQRVLKVATSESGALAAIKADPSLPDVRIRGRTVEEALRDLLPHLKVQTLTESAEREKGITSEVVEIVEARSDAGAESDSEDGEMEAAFASDRVAPQRSASWKYLRMALLIVEAAKRWVAGRMVSGSEEDSGQLPGTTSAATTGKRQPFYGPHNLDPPFGCDAFLIAGGHYLPVHRTILAARVPSLQQALANPSSKVPTPPGVKVSAANARVATISLSQCSFNTSLFFLHYIYSDDLPPIWVPSIGLGIEKELKAAKIDRNRVQEELKTLAEALDLPALMTSVKANIPRPPLPTLREDMEALFTSYVDVEDPAQALFHDVLLTFKDRTVPAHSTVLRRSPFFSALFQPHWTSDRWDQDNVITLDMSHLRWEVARIVLLHLYTDNGEALFRGCDADRSLEQYMDFLVEIMAASNELLLDKLKLVSSSLLRKRILAHTVGAVLTEASFYHADQLKEITMDYCTKSLETLLEGGMLTELDYSNLRELTMFVRKKQDEKCRRSLANDRIAALIEKHRDYYDDLDIPPPSLHLNIHKVQPKKASGFAGVRSPNLSPFDANRRRPSNRAGASSPISPDLRPADALRSLRSPPAAGNDSSEVFEMDEEEITTPKKDTSFSKSGGGSPWAILPQVNHLSLDDATERASSASRPWKSKTREAEKRLPSGDTPSSSPALRPVDTPSDLRSIMAQEQRRQQMPNRFSTNSTPSGSGTSTPVQRTSTAGFEISPINVANARLSQKERKRLQQQQPDSIAAAVNSAASTPAKPQSVSNASPWRTSVAPGSSPPNAASSPWSLKAAATTAMAISHSQEGTPPAASMLAARRPSAAPLQQSVGQRGSPLESSASTANASGSISAMGPTYTPTRMGPTTVPKRMVSGDSAWSTPSFAPPPSPFGTSPSLSTNASLSGISAGRPAKGRSSSNLQRPLLASNAPASPRASLDETVSQSSVQGDQSGNIGASGSRTSSSAQLTFAQIQEQQRMAIEMETEHIRMAGAAKKSFLDIQEEERKVEMRRKEEKKQAEEFEKWFAEESKRVQGQKKGGGKHSIPEGNTGGVKSKGAKKQQQQQQGGPPPGSTTTGKGKNADRKADKAKEGSKSGKAGQNNKSGDGSSGGKGDRVKANSSTLGAAPAAAAGGDGDAKGGPAKDSSGVAKKDGGSGSHSQQSKTKPNQAQAQSNGRSSSGSLNPPLPPKPSTSTTTTTTTSSAGLSAAAPTFSPRQPR